MDRIPQRPRDGAKANHKHTTERPHRNAAAGYRDDGTLSRRPKQEPSQHTVLDPKEEKARLDLDNYVRSRNVMATGTIKSLAPQGARIVDDQNIQRGFDALTNPQSLQPHHQRQRLLTLNHARQNSDQKLKGLATINVSINNINKNSGRRSRSCSYPRSRILSDDYSESGLIPAAAATFPTPEQWKLIQNQRRPVPGSERLPGGITPRRERIRARLSRLLFLSSPWQRVLLYTIAALCVLYAALLLSCFGVTEPLCLCPALSSIQSTSPTAILRDDYGASDAAVTAHPSDRQGPRSRSLPVIADFYDENNGTKSVPLILAALRSSVSTYVYNSLELSCGCAKVYVVPEYVRAMCSWPSDSDQDQAYHSLTGAIEFLDLHVQDDRLLRGPKSITTILDDISVVHSSSHKQPPPESPPEPTQSFWALASSRFHPPRWLCAMCFALPGRVAIDPTAVTTNSHILSNAAFSVVEATKAAASWHNARLEGIQVKLKYISTILRREPACKVYNELFQELAKEEKLRAFAVMKGGAAIRATPARLPIQEAEELTAIFSLPCKAWKDLTWQLRLTIDEMQKGLTEAQEWIRQLDDIKEAMTNDRATLDQHRLYGALEHLMVILEKLAVRNKQ